MGRMSLPDENSILMELNHFGVLQNEDSENLTE